MKTTPPDKLCKWPHKWPCLAHIRVLNGEFKACEICAPHVEKAREQEDVKKRYPITEAATISNESKP